MKTLADRIAQDGPVNELDAVGWAIRLAKRLEALHALGVAHGSVSPACIISDAAERTSKGYLADVQFTTGILAYQSPERVRGGDLSPADDTWAVAATLYTALTARMPFDGVNDAETCQKILAASPAPLAVYDVGDDDLQQIIERAFARELSARTTTVIALRHALEEWHPDPAVGSLLPLDDEDTSTDGVDADDQATRAHRVRSLISSQPDDDEDDARTLAIAPLVADGADQGAGAFPRRPSKGAPVFSARTHGSGSEDDDDDDEDEVRTVMRTLRMEPGHPDALPARPGPGPAAWPYAPGRPADPRLATGPRMPAGLGPAPFSLQTLNSSSQPENGSARRPPAGFPGSDPGASYGARPADLGPPGALQSSGAAWPGSPYQQPQAGFPGGPTSAGMAPFAPGASAAQPARPSLHRGIWIAALVALLVAALTFALLRFRIFGI